MKARFVKLQGTGQLDPRTGREKVKAVQGSPDNWDIINVPADAGSENDVLSYAAQKLGMSESQLSIQARAFGSRREYAIRQVAIQAVDW